MAKSPVDTEMFSIQNIVDAVDIAIERIGGISREQLLEVFFEAMRAVNYREKSKYGGRGYYGKRDKFDNAYWTHVEDYILKLINTPQYKRTGYINQYSETFAPFATPKAIIDVGMYQSEGEKFFVAFTSTGEQEFDDWAAAEKYLNAIDNAKLRWVTENEPPASATVVWADDEDDDDDYSQQLDARMTTIKPINTHGVTGNISSGLVPPAYFSK